ncbi:hypothetical protein ED733_005561 [Metarhizium rileyi]|uniref:Uncharacterized protein n=1 Tax=Metarhizium rileyi (strain RCEF 4871) TaxID=1649241 RepID=A0A5C6GHW3_METRR|nr:hypothetical protein ED733_005561 [Metarhizium rileyi]
MKLHPARVSPSFDITLTLFAHLRKSGRAFFCREHRRGRQTIVETTTDGLGDVLPKDYSVRNRVYENGGSFYDVLPDDRLIFSHADDTFSFDGAQVSWVEWNRPNLPFDAGKLYVGSWTARGTVENARLMAGQKCESVAEPRWGPDGPLFFVKKTGSYRKMYQIPPGGKSEELIHLDGLDDAE